jgi:hypothetical protein
MKETDKSRRPPGASLLILAPIILAIGAIPAGIGLALEPSGAYLGFSLEQLAGSPFHNYLIPGLFLFAIIGVWSLVVAYGLWKRPAWPWTQRLAGWSGRHWSWAAALLQGIILVAWIVIQGSIIGFNSFLQLIYFLFGLVLVVLCALPTVREYYAAAMEAP